jgi:hemerythrin
MGDRFPWSDEYLTGHEAIDNDHRKLFEIANNVFLIENPHEERDRVSDAVRELYDYMRVHFEREESVMSDLSYSDLDTHREKHADIIHRMNESLRNSRNFDDLGNQLKAVMEDWLIKHIIQEDMIVKELLTTPAAG